MKIIVQKFGGTSVADIERLKNVAQIVQEEVHSGSKVVVVVSAMAGVTNSLIAKCNALSRLDSALHMREYDVALSSGEVVSASLLALQLQNIGIIAKSLQSWQVGLKSEDSHGNAQIVEVDSDKIKNLLNSGITPVITGFQAVNANDDITTLGKGGSDTSAAIIAASLDAIRCDIYTDVDGIYSADPRIIHDAKKIDNIHIDELYALCSSGAKVLHPRASLAAKRYGINMRVLSSFTKNSGTTIKTGKINMENRLVTAITSNKNLLKIDISHGIESLDKIIEDFTKNSIQIDQMHNLDCNNLTIITNLTNKSKCQNLLDHLKGNGFLKSYKLNTDISTVTVVGYAIQSDVSFVSKVINILTHNNVSILSSYVSDVKMSVLMHDNDTERSVHLLHNSLL